MLSQYCSFWQNWNTQTCIVEITVVVGKSQFWSVYRVIPSPASNPSSIPHVHYSQINDAKLKWLTRAPLHQNHNFDIFCPVLNHDVNIFEILFQYGQNGLFWDPYLKCQTSVSFCACMYSTSPSQYWLFQTPHNARWQLLTEEKSNYETPVASDGKACLSGGGF